MIEKFAVFCLCLGIRNYEAEFGPLKGVLGSCGLLGRLLSCQSGHLGRHASLACERIDEEGLTVLSERYLMLATPLHGHFLPFYGSHVLPPSLFLQHSTITLIIQTFGIGKCNINSSAAFDVNRCS